MAVEIKRGCGYRKVGWLYLVGSGLSAPCDRLPFNLETCPVCGQGIKFSRAYQAIDWFKFAGEHKDCIDGEWCVICHPKRRESLRYGLMWVGKRFYTPGSFVAEAMRYGVSKRIAMIPKELELGKTWILLAHVDAGIKTKINGDGEIRGEHIERCPAIFYAFLPLRIETLLTESQATETELERLRKRGITPVVIPDGDRDHIEGNPYSDIPVAKQNLELALL